MSGHDAVVPGLDAQMVGMGLDRALDRIGGTGTAASRSGPEDVPWYRSPLSENAVGVNPERGARAVSILACVMPLDPAACAPPLDRAKHGSGRRDDYRPTRTMTTDKQPGDGRAPSGMTG